MAKRESRNAGKYNRLVEIFTAKETADDASGLQRTLTYAGKAWAYYKGVTGDKQLMGSSQGAFSLVDWSIRLPIPFYLGLQSVIKFDGDEYEVVDPNVSQNFEEITLRTRVRQGS